jgi:hypothetical protein
MTRYYIVRQCSKYRRIVVPQEAKVGAYTCKVKKNGEIIYSPIVPLTSIDKKG